MDLSTPHKALMFAYNVNPVCRISRYFSDLQQRTGVVRASAGNVTGNEARLTPWDRVAQAGMIQCFVNGMQEPMRSHVMARYGRREAWPVAHACLTREAVQRGFTQTPQLTTEIIAWWYGKKWKTARLVQRFEVHRNTVQTQKKRVDEMLCTIALRADDLLMAHLQIGE